GVQLSLRLFANYFSEQGCQTHVFTSQLRSLDELMTRQWKTVHHFPTSEVRKGVHIHRYDSGGVLDSLLGLTYAVSRRLKMPFSMALEDAYRLRVFRQWQCLRDILRFKPDVLLVAP